MSATARTPIESKEQKRQREAKRAYLDRLPEYPDFTLPNDQIDGLVPSSKVGSWEELLGVLQGDAFKKTKNDLVYRGHGGHNWQLSSTLGRLFVNGEIPSGKRARLLRQFKLSMRGRGYDLAPLESDEEVWAVGQHYGLKTPLLDWTRSPFVALFFAFEKHENQAETDDNPSRAVFCINKTRLEEDVGEEFVEKIFLEPEDHRNSRLVNQSGLFTIAPDGNDNLVSLIVKELDDADLLGSVDETESSKEPDEHASPEADEGDVVFAVRDRKRAQLLSDYIFKLHIPNSMNGRKGCLEALRQMNIHHGNLFPDPGGASDFCNDWLERWLEDEKKEAAKDERDEEDREIAEAVKPKPTVDISDDVIAILCGFLELDEDQAQELAAAISRAVADASSHDWQNFRTKRAIVKRAITKAIAAGPGTIKPERKVDELIELLLEKFASAAGDAE
jgi:hypothetical protein